MTVSVVLNYITQSLQSKIVNRVEQPLLKMLWSGVPLI